MPHSPLRLHVRVHRPKLLCLYSDCLFWSALHGVDVSESKGDSTTVSSVPLYIKQSARVLAVSGLQWNTYLLTYLCSLPDLTLTLTWFVCIPPKWKLHTLHLLSSKYPCCKTTPCEQFPAATYNTLEVILVQEFLNSKCLFKREREIQVGGFVSELCPGAQHAEGGMV